MFQLSPKTEKLVVLFASADYGVSFTYADILRTTDCDLLGADRQRVYSAIRVLEREHERTLSCDCGVGYTVTPPERFKAELEGRIRAAGKQMVRAKHTGEAAPLKRLDDVQRRELVAVQTHVAVLDQQLRGIAKRTARIEAALQREGIELDPPTIDGTAIEEIAA
jgi:hypothetical protein